MTTQQRSEEALQSTVVYVFFGLVAFVVGVVLARSGLADLSEWRLYASDLLIFVGQAMIALGLLVPVARHCRNDP